jgi:hypothetical protein
MAAHIALERNKGVPIPVLCFDNRVYPENITNIGIQGSTFAHAFV